MPSGVLEAILRALRSLLRIAGQAVRNSWHVLRVAFGHALGVVLALVVLFEEWGWKPLSDLLAWFARFRLWARIEGVIAGLPPWGALIVFALPTTILFPLKLAAVWLLAKGQALAAGALFIGAKVASTALIARIFMLTKPALMRLAWFARAYNWFIPWKEALFAEIRASWVWRYSRMLKNWLRLELKRSWARLRPVVIARWTRLRAIIKDRAGRMRLEARRFWLRISGKA